MLTSANEREEGRQRATHDIKVVVLRRQSLVFFLVSGDLVELDVVVLVSRSERVGFVDLGRLGKFTVRLEVTGLVGGVLLDNIGLVVLEITEREENDVSLVDPDLTLSHANADENFRARVNL